MSSTSESEMEGAIRKLSESDSGEEEETEPAPGCSKWGKRTRKGPHTRTINSKKRRRISILSESESEVEEPTTRPKRPQREQLSEKEKRFSGALKRLKDKRARRKLSEREFEDTVTDDPSDVTEVEDTATDDPSDGNRSGGSAPEDNVIYKTCYRHVDDAFKAKYPGVCRFPNCQQRFVPGQTQIIGVWFTYELDQKKPAWICAKHHYWYSKAEREARMKKDSEEQRTSDEDFIYDGEEDDNKSTSTEADERGDESFTRDLQDILQDLRKEKPQDIQHKKIYINELSRYQLEIHNCKNKSIFTSETKRFKRHMRGARFDVGLKTKKN